MWTLTIGTVAVLALWARTSRAKAKRLAFYTSETLTGTPTNACRDCDHRFRYTLQQRIWAAFCGELGSSEWRCMARPNDKPAFRYVRGITEWDYSTWFEWRRYHECGDSRSSRHCAKFAPRRTWWKWRLDRLMLRKPTGV
jgi:rRNA maturation protein Nop10